MSYNKYTWETGEVITADKLNHMEDGIADAVAATRVVTLAAANWSDNTITVSCNGVTASNTVIASPAPLSYTAYEAAGAYCFSQSADSLTFKCSTTPSDDLTVNVAII